MTILSAVFANGAAKVLVAEESGSGRQLVGDVVRGMGFQDIIIVGSCEDALRQLEVETPDWLIMPLFVKEPVNALHLLKLVATVPRLRKTRMSLIVGKGENDHLDAAFELGLMSCHPKTYLRDEFLEELRNVIKSLRGNGWRSSLTAGHYLRQHLLKDRRYGELVALEKELLAVFPGTPNVLLRLGEAQLMAGETDAGLSSLHQAGLIDAKAKQSAEALVLKVMNVKMVASGAAPYNILGVASCVVIDPDTAVLSSTRKLLEAIGIPAIHTFDNPQEAWTWLETHPEPGLILQEWRLPGLPGPLLLQRIRQHGFLNVPLLVLSSVISANEMPLLREMGVDQVIPKPFGAQLFYRSLIWAVQQSQAPTEQRSLERKIRRLLEAKQRGEADRLRAVYMSDSRIPVASKRQMDAEFAFESGNFRLCRELAVEALKLSGDSLLLLNLIGKCLMILRDHKTALKFFEKARSLSPMNVDHLCNIAVSQLELGAEDAANATMAEARKVDGENLLVQTTGCQIAIMGSDAERARTLMGELKSVAKVVGYMNNRAVALTRCGLYEDGIALYQKTWSSLPGVDTDTHAVVTYNLGLAYARYGNLAAAKSELDKIVGREDSSLSKKARSLLSRVERAMTTGSALSFHQQETTDESSSMTETKIDDDESIFEVPDEVEDALEVRRGDLCLNRIFTSALTHDASIQLIGNLPRFKTRNAIKKVVQ